MEHLEGEQYSQYPVEGNSRGYMSMRDYRDQWMSAPFYMVPPQYAFLSQPQPPQPISPVEQAILDLTKLVGDAVVEQKEFNAQLSKKIYTVENPLEQTLDEFQSEVGQQVDSIQCSISKLAQQLDHQGEENPEDDCLTDIMAEDQCDQQPHQELIEDFIELSEGLDESSDMCDVVFPRENQEEIIAVLTEVGSGIEAGKEPQKLTLQPIPMKLNSTANAQATKYPLPVAPSIDQVYILPSPTTQST